MHMIIMYKYKISKNKAVKNRNTFTSSSTCLILSDALVKFSTLFPSITA